MIMSALSPWMFAARSPRPLWFSSPDVPCLIHKCCHPSSLQVLSQSMEFIYESAPGLGLHAHTLVEHPQPEGVPSWAHSPSLPWLLCSSQALLQLAWHLILSVSLPLLPQPRATMKVQFLSLERCGLTGFTTDLHFVSLNFLI